MANVNDKRKNQWKENYKKLIAAGLSSKDASRINKSNKNTELFLSTGKMPEKNISKQKAGLIGSEKRREKSQNKKPNQIKPKKSQQKIPPKKEPENKKAAPKRAAGKRKSQQFDSTIKRWYRDISDVEKYYYSQFTYLIEFKRRDGSTDFISITSSKMLSAEEVKRQARQILVETYFLPTPRNTPQKQRRGGSDPTKVKPLLSSIKIVERIYNPGGI